LYPLFLTEITNSLSKFKIHGKINVIYADAFFAVALTGAGDNLSHMPAKKAKKKNKIDPRYGLMKSFGKSKR
jgi:hypothetical protein